MKIIGMIGGMSWESTAHYYELLNREARRRLGGLSSAELLLWSVDFEPIEQLQAAGDWEGAGRRLADIARRLEGAGAEVVILCTNTMHRVAPAITGALERARFLHIADATAEVVRARGISRVGLLGTRYTMEQDFYATRLAERSGAQVLVPDEQGRAEVHRVIYDELCQGEVCEPSRRRFEAIVERLVARGAEGVVLGCTEIGLLLPEPSHAGVPLLDTTRIHAHAALAASLAP